MGSTSQGLSFSVSPLSHLEMKKLSLTVYAGGAGSANKSLVLFHGNMSFPTWLWSTERDCRGIPVGRAPDRWWSRTTRHHRSLSGTCHLHQRSSPKLVFYFTAALLTLGCTDMFSTDTSQKSVNLDTLNRDEKFTVSNQLQQVDLNLTWLPVSTESLVITLPQHKEVDHVRHVVIPGGQINLGSITLRPHSYNKRNLLTWHKMTCLWFCWCHDQSESVSGSTVLEGRVHIWSQWSSQTLGPKNVIVIYY